MRQVLIAAVLTLGAMAVVAAPSPAVAQSQPDFKKAAEHYKAAEAAMAAELYLDAAREYAIAYEITRDAVLFFKIATANDKGGKCEIATTYYRRYLREGKPDDEYKKLTQERIEACRARTGAGPATGATGPAPSATPAAKPSPPPAKPSPPATTTTEPARSETPAPTAAPTAPATDDDDAEPAVATDSTADGYQPLSVPAQRGPAWRRGVGWIAIAVAGGAAIVGAVMVQSANSTEQDLDDLMSVRPDGRPLTFDDATRDRYDELVDEGKRFNTLSMVSFGIAGASAAVAITMFVLDAAAGGSESTALHLAPTAGADGATVGAGWRF